MPREGISVGAEARRPDGQAKVTGSATYPADAVPADALWAQVVFTNQPHARIVSLDTTVATASDGVVLVLTAADVPVNEYGLTMSDQPVMVGPQTSDQTNTPSDVSRWEADHLAVVIAETKDRARAAAALIEVEWDQLPVVADVATARTDEVLVHTEAGSNTYYEMRIEKGDVAQAWDEADAIVEGTYELPHQEHAFLGVEAGTAWIDDQGRVTVQTAGQWTHEDREQVAHALGLDEDAVRIIYTTAGGAFGGKEDMSVQIVLGLAALRLHQAGIHRPVHTRWSREESIVGHHKRHRATIWARHGAKADGTLVAVDAEVLLDAGAYNYTSNKVLGNAHLSVAGAYEIPNATIVSQAIYTNAVPGGAFRGFGGPQGAFVAETQMNKLAAELGIDPIELRRRNVLREGSIGITQAPLPAGVTLPEVVEACAAAAAQPRPEPAPLRPLASLPAATSDLRRGRGFAAGYKNVGFSFGFPERCEAEIRLYPADGADPDQPAGPPGTDQSPARAELFHSGAEVGQGAHLAFRQMAADATGLALDAVSATYSDTAVTGDSGSASASRLTFMAGNSILGAAEEADKAWRNGDRPAIGTFRYTPPPTESLDPETGAGQPNFAYGYMAQAVEVTVDVGTGHIRVDRVTSTHDVGRAINPALVKGQVEGAVVQAHGYALSENLVVTDGRIQNPRLSTYLIPGIGDIPGEVDSVILELADPRGPFGARGMAEMPYITYAPAVVAAVHDATGVWFDQFPLTPDRVLAGLRSAGVTSQTS